MLARRLLIAGGGASFTAGAPLSTSTLTSPGEGGGVWFGSPRGYRDGGSTIIGYQTGTSSGDVKAVLVDNATKAVTSTVTHYDNFILDDHSPASYVVRPDGIIMAAFAYHVGELYVGIGTSPGVIPAQAQVTNITSQVGSISGLAGYTYGSIAYVPDEDRYYIFFRFHDTGGTAHLGYTYSDDDGATWAARTLVCVVTYHRVVNNGTDRLDIVVSNHPDDAGNHDIRHMYFTGGEFYQSDGTHITATQPFAITDATQVWDGSTTMGWHWDIAVDGSGHPVVAFATFPGATNPGGPATDHRYYDGRWSGSAWSTHEIAHGGGKIPTSDQPTGNPQSFYSGGVALDPSDPQRVLFSSNDIGGAFQIYYAVTADGGATYTITALTSDSDKNVRPHWVVGHGDEVQGFYWYGTYANYKSYSQGIRTVGL